MDSESCKHAALAKPVSTGGFSAAVNKHSEEIHELRWILLNQLWHSLPSEMDDDLIVKQMMKAGASKEEVEKLSG